ncbi:MAG: Holliday junction resolvase RecU [Bacillales bacterium]|jgi:recombination protein U|nr:Holliday junction resolvase RecU [Bacillales bacterium]
MINYPNKIKQETKKTPTKLNISSNRGMLLENIINISNDYYLNNNIAVIYKKPTPLKILKTTKESHYQVIEKAIFLAPSTTDYNGIYKGKYLDFDAKETNSTTSFPLGNVHINQIVHLQRIAEHGGFAFLIIFFKAYNEIYLVDQSLIQEQIKKGIKSIPYLLIKQTCPLIEQGFLIQADYLKAVDKKYFNLH